MKSVRHKILLVLVVTMVMLAATAHLVERFVVVPSFQRLEQAAAQKDLARGIEALRAEMHHLAVLCHDWAAWDDTYQFIVDGNADYIRNNLTLTTVSNNKLSLLCYVAPTGRVVWHSATNLEGIDHRQAPTLLPALNDPDDRLVARRVPGDGVTGVVLTPQGPLLVSSQPITTTEEEGPVRGAILMGRLLDAEAIRALSLQTHVPLAVWSVADGRLPVGERRILAETKKMGGSVARLSPSEIQSYTQVPGVYGGPALLVRATTSRSISHQGDMAARVATMSNLAAGMLITLVLWGALHWIVVDPLARVTNHVVRVGKEDNLAARLNLCRQDEIGTLADEFDRMTGRLADFHRQSLETAHQAGMADIASQVLHNVGNAMNAVSVSADLVAERLHHSKAAGLDRAADLLSENQHRLTEFFATDPRGAKLAGYLVQLAPTLRTERLGLIEETANLQRAVDGICEIIAAQQGYAGGPAFSQPYDLAELVDGALRMFAPVLDKAGIGVVRDIRPLEPVPVNKNKLVQVLVNLLKNGMEAIQASRQSGGVIRIFVGDDGQGQALVEISDNGRGIDRDTLARLFRQGFTTRAEGHGLGLHFCATALSEMGGTITARSDGLGHGATMTLRLPIHCLEKV